MSDNSFNIQTDVTEVQAALEETSRSLKSIQRQVLGTVARGSVKKIKSVISQTTQRNTGWLASAYRYKVARSGESVSVFPKSHTRTKDRSPQAVASAKNLSVAIITTLSYGATISNREGRHFLQVNGSGYYARPKSVYIPARGFVQSGEQYVQENSYSADLDNLIDKELKKYWS